MKVSITVGSTTQETTLEGLLQYAPRYNEPAGTKETVTAGIMALFQEAVEEEWQRTQDQIAQASKVFGWDIP